MSTGGFEEIESSDDPVRVDLAPAPSHGYAAIVSLCGEHDLATSEAIRTALAPIYGDLLIDLSESEFIDSTVIGVLLKKFEDLRREGCRLDLLIPLANTSVGRIVDITGLASLMTVRHSMPDDDAPRRVEPL